jgi:hypothetical protein
MASVGAQTENEISPQIPNEDWPDSIYHWNWDALNLNWVYDSKEYYLLNEAENKYQIHGLVWDGSGWINSYIHSYSYDDFDNLIEYTSQKWKDSTWAYSIRYSYQFDDQNQETGFLYEKWIDTTWVNNLLRSTTYAQNPKWVQRLQQDWNGFSWENQVRNTFLYDVSDVVVRQIQENWQGAWDSTYQTFYSYSTLPDVDSTRLQAYDENEGWFDLTRNMEFRDENGDSYHFLNQHHFGEWENYSQSFTTFDSNHHEMQYVRQVWDTSWINSVRNEYGYNSDGNILSSVRQGWQGEWQLTDSTHYYYPFQTALDAEPLPSSLAIYPNPASSFLRVDEPGNWIIYSNTGVIVLKSNQEGQNSLEIDVSQLIPGIYSLVVRHENRTSVEQFLKL